MTDTATHPSGPEKNLALLENVAAAEGSGSNELELASLLVKRLPKGTDFDATSARNYLRLARSWILLDAEGKKLHYKTSAIESAKDLYLELPKGTVLTETEARSLLERAGKWKESEKRTMKLLTKAAGENPRPDNGAVFTEYDIKKASSLSFRSGRIPADVSEALDLLSGAVRGESPAPISIGPKSEAQDATPKPVAQPTPTEVLPKAGASGPAPKAAISSGAKSDAQPASAPAAPRARRSAPSGARMSSAQVARQQAILESVGGKKRRLRRAYTKEEVQKASLIASRRGVHITSENAEKFLETVKQHLKAMKKAEKLLGKVADEEYHEQRGDLRDDANLIGAQDIMLYSFWAPKTESEALDILMQAKLGLDGYIKYIAAQNGFTREEAKAVRKKLYNSERVTNEAIRDLLSRERLWATDPAKHVRQVARNARIPINALHALLITDGGLSQLSQDGSAPAASHMEDKLKKIYESLRPGQPADAEETGSVSIVYLGWKYVLKEVAGQNGFTEQDAERAAASLMNEAPPKRNGEATRKALEALNSLKYGFDEVEALGTSQGYSLEVISALERRCIELNAKLSRQAMLDLLEEERMFQADPAGFMHKATSGIRAIAGHELDAAALSEFLSGLNALIARIEQAQKSGTEMPHALTITKCLKRAEQISAAAEFELESARRQKTARLHKAAGQMVFVLSDEELARGIALIIEAQKRHDLARPEVIASRDAHLVKILESHRKEVKALREAYKELGGAEIPFEHACEKFLSLTALKRELEAKIEEAKRAGKTDVGEKLGTVLARLQASKLKDWFPPLDMPAARAVEEARASMRADGRIPASPEEAMELYMLSRWRAQVKSRMAERTKSRGEGKDGGELPPLLSKAVGEEALSRILSGGLDFEGRDAEERFFAAICKEKGEPYPAMLALRLRYRAGEISGSVYKNALERLESGMLKLDSEEEMGMALGNISRALGENGSGEEKAKPGLVVRQDYVASGEGDTYFASEQDSGLLPRHPTGKARAAARPTPLAHAPAETGEEPTLEASSLHELEAGKPQAEEEKPAAEEAKTTVETPAPTALIERSRSDIPEPPPAPETAEDSAPLDIEVDSAAEEGPAKTVQVPAVKPELLDRLIERMSAPGGIPAGTATVQIAAPAIGEKPVEVTRPAQEEAPKLPALPDLDSARTSQLRAPTKEQIEAAAKKAEEPPAPVEEAAAPPGPAPEKKDRRPAPDEDSASVAKAARGRTLGGLPAGFMPPLVPTALQSTEEIRKELEEGNLPPRPSQVMVAPVELAGKKDMRPAPEEDSASVAEAARGRTIQLAALHPLPGSEAPKLPALPDLDSARTSQLRAPTKEQIEAAAKKAEEPSAPAEEAAAPGTAEGAPQKITEADIISRDSQIPQAGAQEAPAAEAEPHPASAPSDLQRRLEAQFLGEPLPPAQPPIAEEPAGGELRDVGEDTLEQGFLGEFAVAPAEEAVVPETAPEPEAPAEEAMETGAAEAVQEAEETGEATGRLPTPIVSPEPAAAEAEPERPAEPEAALPVEPAAPAEVPLAISSWPEPTPPAPVISEKERIRQERSLAIALRRLLIDPDQAKKLSAADELGGMGTPAALDGLAGAMDLGGNIAQRASSILVSHADNAVPAISTVMAEGTDNGKFVAISALATIATPSAYEEIAKALKDGNADVAEEAAFRLLLAHDRTDIHTLFLQDLAEAENSEKRVLSLLERMLLNERGDENERKTARLQAAKLLSEMVDSRKSSGACAVLCKALGEKDSETAKVVTSALSSGGSIALPHVTDTLTSRDETAATMRAAVLALSFEGEPEEMHYAYVALLRAADSKPTLMDVLRHQASFGGICKVLMDGTASIYARKAAARLVYEKEEKTAVPLLLQAHASQPDMQEYLFDMLKSGNIRKMLNIAFTSTDEGVVRGGAALALSFEKEEDVHNAHLELLDAADSSEVLMGIARGQAPFMALCGVLMDGAAPKPARQAAARLVYEKGGEIAVPLLLQAHASQPDMQDYLFDMLKSGDARETLKMALTQARKYGTVYDSIIKELAEEHEGVAMGVFTEYAEEQHQEGRLTPEEARFLISTVPLPLEGFAPDGAALLGTGLRLFGRMDEGQKAAVRNFIRKVGPSSAQVLSDYAKTEEAEGRLTDERFLPDGASLLGPLVQLLEGMDLDQRTALCSFTRRVGPAATPVFLAYAKLAAAEGKLTAENINTLIIALDPLRDNASVELLGYALPHLGQMDASKLDNVKKFAVDLDQDRAERMIIDYAASARLEPKELMLVAEVELYVAEALQLSEGRIIHSNGAELLSLMLLQLNSMDDAQVSAAVDYASSPLFTREDCLGNIELFLSSGTRLASLTEKEAGATALMLARIGTDDAYKALTEMVDERKLPGSRLSIPNAVKNALASQYDNKTVRSMLLRAAFAEQGDVSTLGQLAFELFADKKDAGKDVIEGCIVVHKREPVEPAEEAEPKKSVSRVLPARELLVAIADKAIGPLCEIAVSPDWSRYPLQHRENLLRTIACISEQSGLEETRAKAKECMLEAVKSPDMSASVVAGALRMLEASVTNELARMLYTDKSVGEERACAILVRLGAKGQEQINAMLYSADEAERSYGTALLRLIIPHTKEISEKNAARLAALLRDQSPVVRGVAEEALSLMGKRVPVAELEEVMVGKIEETELLPYSREMQLRMAAAKLFVQAGARAAEALHRVFSILDSGTPKNMSREAAKDLSAEVAAEAAASEELHEAIVLSAKDEKGFTKKARALNSIMDSESAMAELLLSMRLDSPDWHDKMREAGFAKGSRPEDWKVLLLKWAVVRHIALRYSPTAAGMLKSLEADYGFFKAEELAVDLRLALDDLKGFEYMRCANREKVAQHYKGILEGAKIRNEAIEKIARVLTMPQEEFDREYFPKQARSFARPRLPSPPVQNGPGQKRNTLPPVPGWSGGKPPF